MNVLEGEAWLVTTSDTAPGGLIHMQLEFLYAPSTVLETGPANAFVAKYTELYRMLRSQLDLTLTHPAVVFYQAQAVQRLPMLCAQAAVLQTQDVGELVQGLEPLLSTVGSVDDLAFRLAEALDLFENGIKVLLSDSEPAVAWRQSPTQEPASGGFVSGVAEPHISAA